MGLEVGGRAAIERLSGSPQGFLTATRGERREGEGETDSKPLSLKDEGGMESSPLFPGCIIHGRVCPRSLEH